MSLSMFDINTITGKDLSFLNDLDCHLIDTEELLVEAFNRLQNCEYLALDTEAEGLSPMHHNIVGVILAPSSKESYYFPLRHKIGQNVEEASFIYYFKKLCQTAKFILFHAKFDWKMIWFRWHVDFVIAADAQIQAYLLNSDLAESKNLSLKHLTKEVFGVAPLELSDYGEYNFAMFDPKEAYKYACPDGTNTFALYEHYKPQIEAENLQRVEKLELLIIKPIGLMELKGVLLDTNYLQSLTGIMKEKMAQLQTQIYQEAGREFDINSAQQLAQILYDELGIKPVTRHGKEDKSTGADILEELARKEKLPKLILDYREVAKLYSDFVIKLPDCIAEDGRLHSQFNQIGTRSGRFSSSGGAGRGGKQIKANLQQIPNNLTVNTDIEIEVPDDCGLDPTKEYTPEELDTVYPNWRQFAGNII